MLRITFILLPVLMILAPAAVEKTAKASSAGQAVYSLEECQQCHEEEYHLLKENGKAHWTKLTCLKCHRGHSKDTPSDIPACGKCHQGLAHFTFEPCSVCHRNAHTPLKVFLEPNISEPCIPCHYQQASELKKFPSKHSKEHCTSCHEEHGRPPGCLECHRPHTGGMNSVDCLTCHQAHKPRDISYNDSVSSWMCAVCHAQVAESLAKSSARHNKLDCVTCHKNKHGWIPTCVYCHPPHPAQTSRGNCDTCHAAHAPLPVKPLIFGPETPSERCAACHGAILDLLRAGSTRHHKLECVFCHSGNHGTTPRCEDCHGLPHSRKLLEKFSTCGNCHQTAHDLVR